jgi:hypothetical protein
MRGKRRGENDRAQQRGKLSKEFWSGPLRYWTKSPENKRLCRRLVRRKLNREIQ